ERNYIRNKFIPELRATETFFQPTSIDRYIKTIQQDNYWKHRTKLQGDKLLLCLRQDDWREFNIPHQLPGQIAGMSEFLHEIEDAIK
ncbi:MAG: hypothetical protein ACAH80_06635, partial [Alphaproteobacteria bacterium]